MRVGNASACDLVGFPPEHGAIFQQVANDLDCVISSRAVGRACTGLIQDGYALKGFRIDTKSCSWGPMMGFVCVDPRLNKEGSARVRFNRAKTHEALSGEIPEGLSFPHPGEAEGWKADVVPIAITGARLTELEGGVDGKRITTTIVGPGLLRGRAEHLDVDFPYVLIRLPEGSHPSYGQIRGEVWGVFVDPDYRPRWEQEYPAGVGGVWHRHGGRHYEALLGLANPGTGDRGYKAAVTGDYDLFAVWPKEAAWGHATARPTAVELEHEILLRRLNRQRGLRPRLPNRAPGQPRPGVNWDQRPLARGNREHFLMGNISKRINLVKILLNTRLQAQTEVPAFGQCVHHSDEVGNLNPLLSKSLRESLPVIAFMPKNEVYGIESIGEMKAFCLLCSGSGYHIDLRPNWRVELRLD